VSSSTEAGETKDRNLSLRIICGQIKPNERLVENPTLRHSIDLDTRMGVLRPFRIFRKLAKIKNVHSSEA